MGARGPAEGLRQGPREALVQLRAAAAQRQPWRGLNRWRPCTSRRTAKSNIGTVQLR